MTRVLRHDALARTVPTPREARKEEAANKSQMTIRDTSRDEEQGEPLGRFLDRLDRLDRQRRDMTSSVFASPFGCEKHLPCSALFSFGQK